MGSIHMSWAKSGARLRAMAVTTSFPNRHIDEVNGNIMVSFSR